MSDISSYRWAFTITGVIFGLYSILAMTNCVRVIRERPQSLDQPRAPLAACVLRAFKNVAFRPLLMAWTLDGLALSALVAMFPFYVRYVIISDGYRAQEKGTAWQPMVLMGSRKEEMPPVFSASCLPSRFCLKMSAIRNAF